MSLAKEEPIPDFSFPKLKLNELNEKSLQSQSELEKKDHLLQKLGEQVKELEDQVKDIISRKEKLLNIIEQIFLGDTYRELNHDLRDLNKEELLDHFLRRGFDEDRVCGEKEIMKIAQDKYTYTNNKLMRFLLREGRYILEANPKIDDSPVNKETTRRLSKTLGSRMNLNQNKDFLVSIKHTLFDAETLALATFIPKNGCTNLRYSFAMSNKYIQGPEDLDWIHENNSSMNASTEDIQRCNYTFVVLRNIFDRIASTFWNKFVYISEEVPDSDRSHAVIENLFDKYNAKEITFKKFVDCLWTNPLIIKIDEHLRPQSDFLLLEEYDDYFSVDDFKVMKESVESKSKFIIHDTRPFTTHTTYEYEKAESKYYGISSIDELKVLKINKKAPRYIDFYDDEDAYKIASLYLDDIILFCTKTGRYSDLKIFLNKALIHSYYSP